MDQVAAAGSAISVLAILMLVATLWFVRTLRGIRRAAEHQVELLQKQVDLLEHQVLHQGSVQAAATVPWRPSHLRR